jgi:hypothetical protein
MNKLLDATSTPLSSIFGSGFLVIVPVLADAVGAWSVLAMALVCLLAYAVGAVVRFNIRHTEPVLAKDPGEATLSFERASDLALILAYVISICLYLHILSAFVLGGIKADTQFNENMLTTAVIAFITAVGMTKGLKSLDILEEWGLWITLLIITLLLAGFAFYDWNAWQSPAGITLVDSLSHTPWEVVTIVAGTLIVVQGFETPRYLGDIFDTDTRVRASRWSQLLSTGVYIVFVALALPVVHTLNGHYNDNSLIMLVRTAVPFLVAPLVIAAALSQFSAAVADTMAATGNIEEVTGGHLKIRWACALVGLGAVAISWSASTLEILALASRAFAFYYLLQCLVAITVSRSWVQRAGIALLATVLGFITAFAVPAG